MATPGANPGTSVTLKSGALNGRSGGRGIPRIDPGPSHGQSWLRVGANVLQPPSYASPHAARV